MTLDDVLTTLGWLTAVGFVLYRFPVVTFGMGAALIGWTIEPRVCWTALGLTAAWTALLWLRKRPQPTAAPIVRFAGRQPLVALIVVSAVVSRLAEPPIAPVAFVVLLVSLAVLCWSRRETTPETTETAPLALPRPIAGALSTGTAVPCPHCDNPLAVFYGDHPTASCFACGAQFIRVSERMSPTGSPLWLPAPRAS